MDVQEWLKELDPENDIDFVVLAQLTDLDLKELGVISLGHRKRLLAAIAERSVASPPMAGPRGKPSGAWALLEYGDFGSWLNDGGTGLLKPAANDVLQRWPVSKRVNSSRAPDDDPTLIERVDLGPELAANG